MGVRGSLSTERISRRPAAGPRLATPCTLARIVASRGASQCAGAAGTQVCPGLFGELSQSAGSDVGFDLLVPESRIKLEEPRAKTGQVFARQLADGAFDLHDCAHAVNANGRFGRLASRRDARRRSLTLAIRPGLYI